MTLVDRLSGWFSDLSPREQRLLGILAGIFGLVIAFLVWLRVSGAFGDVRAEIERAQSLAAEIEEKREDLSAKFAAQAEKRERDPVPKLATFLEEISNRRAVPVDNYGAEKTVPTKDKRYAETSMEVKLKKVTLEQAAAFLEEIENASEAAYTKQLELNLPRKDQRDSFDVTMNIATYEDTKAPKKDEAKDEKQAGSKPSKEDEEPAATKEPAAEEGTEPASRPTRPFPVRPRPGLVSGQIGNPTGTGESKVPRVPLTPGKAGYSSTGRAVTPAPDTNKEP
jgi:Type II secretion system (T2SS), protein M